MLQKISFAMHGSLFICENQARGHKKLEIDLTLYEQAYNLQREGRIIDRLTVSKATGRLKYCYCMLFRLDMEIKPPLPHGER